MATPQALKRKLSASTDGLPILVAATATPGTLIHTAVASTAAGTYDELRIYATNNHTAAVNVTIERGDATVANNYVQSIPSKSGVYFVIPGFILQNSKTVKAFAGTANVVTLNGWNNAYTEA